MTLIGTNNQFDYTTVIKRWNFIQNELNDRGIEVSGFASDGDSRYIKAQKIMIEYGKPFSKYNQRMICRLQPKLPVIQDPPHICNKLKNRLFDPSGYLVVGSFRANIGHLKLLLTNVPKSEHKLNYEDIDSEDRMHFDCLEKICTDEVFQLLLERVTGSDGTVHILRIIKTIMDDFTKKVMDRRVKLHETWRVVFFLRLWKKWLIKEGKGIEHFITENAYQGIEINAHMLLGFYTNPDYSDVDETTINSQPDEELFRALRSMTSTFDTRVNFTMKDIAARVQKLQAILYIKFVLRDKLCLRKNVNYENNNCKNILTENEVCDILTSAKSKAESDCLQLGIDLDETIDEILTCEIETQHFEKSDKNILEIPENIETKVMETVIENQESHQLLDVDFEHQNLVFSNIVSGKFLNLGISANNLI